MGQFNQLFISTGLKVMVSLKIGSAVVVVLVLHPKWAIKHPMMPINNNVSLHFFFLKLNFVDLCL